MTKLTPWFRVAVKPVRVGWYKARYAGRDGFQHMRWWDGANWCMRPRSTACLFGLAAGDKWRGVAK